MYFLLAILLLCSTTVIAKSVGGVQDAVNGPLKLTPLIQRGEASKARKLSSVDPTLFAGVPSHAAFITVNETNKWNTFFWFFPVENKPLDSTPWIIWLQGGPGSSSLFGLFEELGPLQVSNHKASRRPVTWGSNYSLLFIDNPIGAGFSYSETDEFMSNEDEVGRTLLSFIQQFVQVFPELQKAPLFIAGESYAGKYIPAFGHYLHHHQNESTPVNLKGLVIGDGYTDPPTLMYYSDLLLQTGFIDPDTAKFYKKNEEAARNAWKEGDIKKYMKLAYEVELEWTMTMPNVYNYMKDHDLPTNYISFLNDTHVRNSIHVGDIDYNDQNDAVFNNFQPEMYLSVKPWLEELLEHYGVLCYNGQLDVIVGYALSVHTYRSLKWSGAEAYLKAPRTSIGSTHHGATLDPIGYVKGAGNFMEVMIRAAGHMAPADQPLATKQVLDMFVDKFK